MNARDGWTEYSIEYRAPDAPEWETVRSRIQPAEVVLWLDKYRHKPLFADLEVRVVERTVSPWTPVDEATLRASTAPAGDGAST